MDERLRALYDRLGAAAEKLLTASGTQSFGCPPGCGTCCVGFDPDVTPAELYGLAEWLLENPSLADRLYTARDPAGRTCRFFDAESPFHCTVYPARPLVCRSFGFTARVNKSGTKEFAYCRHMPTDGERRLQGDQIVGSLGTEVPTAEEFGVAVSAIDGNSARRSLSDSIGAAVQHLSYKRSLQLQADPEPPGAPELDPKDPNDPVPPVHPPRAA